MGQKRRQLFGTDGIRGEANLSPMTPDVVMRVGMAVAAHFGRHGRVVVGKDTRRSGYMFEWAMGAGLCAMGADVMIVGPLPTPGIAYITHSMRADAGVVISASHNPFQDNGIKLFAHNGFKLPDALEAQLEALAEPGALDDRVATGDAIGRARRIEDAGGRYITHVKQTFPDEFRLDGVKVVVDCANGAAYKIAPAVLAELGATVVPVGVSPNGTNINHRCGALHPEQLQQLVIEHQADLGVALDGDADRAVFSDEKGQLVDGDAILALMGLEMARSGRLRSGQVVATVMSNLGLEKALGREGISLVRTPVGDRYVVETMRAGGHNLGGEQSGHLVFLDHATTGDGTVAALQVLATMLRRERPLSELAKVMTRFPQVSRSLAVKAKIPMAQLPELRQVIGEVEAELGGGGRTVVRYSGTESKLRIMVEGESEASIEAAADRVLECARGLLA